MTVSSETNKNQYNGNGSQVVFPYTFLIFDEAHLLVVHRDAVGVETILTLNAGTDGYTVDGVGEVTGGNVTTTETYPADTTLTISRNVPETQLTDYIENDKFPAESHERALDKVTMVVQELSEKVERAVKASVVDVSPDMQLPNAILRADRLLGFDSNGDVDVTTSYPNTIHNEMTGLQGGDTDEYYHLNVHEEGQILATTNTEITLGTPADTFLSLDSVANQALIKVANVTVLEALAASVSVGDASNKMHVDRTGDRISFVTDGITSLDLDADINTFRLGELTACGVEVLGDIHTINLFSGVLTELTVDANGMALKSGTSVNEIIDSVTEISGASTDNQLATALAVYEFVNDFPHNSLASLQGGDTGEYYHMNTHEDLLISAVSDTLITIGATGTKITIDSFNELVRIGDGDNLDCYLNVDMDSQQIKGISDGDIVFDAADDIFLKIGAATKFRVDGSGVLLGASPIDSTDGDTVYKFGRAYIGYMGTVDAAGFGHRDQIASSAYAIRQDQNGNVDMNAPTGMTITSKINNQTIAWLNSTGFHLASGEIIDSYDEDLAFTFGRVKIQGSGDQAIIGHRDKSTTDYALKQDANGYTYLNCQAAKNVAVRIGNASVAVFGGASAELLVEQIGTTAAIPVLALNQTDIDDVFLNFIGTELGDGTRSISLDTTQESTKYGAVRVEINGTQKWIRIYDTHS